MIRASLGLLAFVALGSVWAQQAEQARSFTCDKSDQALNPVIFSEAAAVYTEAERACWIDWKHTPALTAGEGAQWIDVRDAGSSRSVSLPGVTAVHLADLGDKTFLKGQSLVLVGTGVDLKALSSRCVELRRSGQFEAVHVLLGGARTWRMAGQPVQVDGSTLPAQEVSAHELWLGAANGLWQIAAVGLNPEQIANLPVQREYLLDLGIDTQQAVARLAERLRHEHLPAPRQWLVIADTPEHLMLARNRWQQQAVDVSGKPLWLSGAWPAYVAYLEQQKTLAAHAGQSLPQLCGI